ncbi:hypothetical protein B0T22DRAFT_288394 [Podospora appendiculata]|uniref:Uncharacterized protein n=1 Tax=Podospora appendiculata TaxID=314037 RepID=A0AAE0X182_9PEZI|nr:hypothetical protein B0T22DRAFT_288394 [Podospora appendiculata]
MLPLGGLFQSSALAGAELSGGGNITEKAITICVTSLAFYGTGEVLASSLQFSVKATAHEPGRMHTISVYLVAILSGCAIDSLLGWASTRDYFVKLEWMFPHYRHPKFTTRHLLVTDDTAQISFSGGLEWALRLWRHVQTLEVASPSIQTIPILPQRQLPAINERQKLPSQNLFYMGQPQQHQPQSEHKICLGSCPRSPWDLISTPLFMPPPSADDETSTYSGSTWTTSTHDTNPNPNTFATPTSSEFSEEESRQSSPGLEFSPGLEYDDIDDDEGMGNYTVQQQIQTEASEQQKRAALDLFASNGDTSGMLAVMASMEEQQYFQSETWEPSYSSSTAMGPSWHN